MTIIAYETFTYVIYFYVKPIVPIRLNEHFLKIEERLRCKFQLLVDGMRPGKTSHGFNLCGQGLVLDLSSYFEDYSIQLDKIS